MWYWAAGEIELVVRLGDDLEARTLLRAIRNEEDTRTSLHSTRSRGYCCIYEQERQELDELASDSLCCEKGVPEVWELDEGSMLLSARVRKLRELRKAGIML